VGGLLLIAVWLIVIGYALAWHGHANLTGNNVSLLTALTGKG
jgi:hypothetical protein